MDYINYLAKDSHMEPEVGKVICLSKVNKLFFGNSDPFCLSGMFELMNSNMVIKKDNKFYILINMLPYYFETVRDRLAVNKHFPYNYFTLVNSEDVPEHYQCMIKALNEYLAYLENKDDMFSKTIKSIIVKNNFVTGEIVDCIPYNYIVQFDKVGKPLIINFTYDSITDWVLQLNKENTETRLETLYLTHKNQLLMEDPKTFLINNLERVTGDINFATMAVTSYLQKDEFTTPVEGLMDLILWKDDESKLAYLHFFMKKYVNIVKESTLGLMTNFEGFNKFLLNLEVKYLQQWEVKEQYNELYYQITHELIRSYELLYQNK